MIPRTAAVAAALAVFAGAHLAAQAAPSPTPAPTSTPSPAPPSPSMQVPPPGATPMPLTLGQAEAIALASSPALALARGQLEAALGQVGVAQAPGLPNLSAAGSTNRSKSTIPAGSFGPGSPGFANLTTSKNGSITLRQLIIDGGRIHEDVTAARFSSESARYNVVRQIQDVEFGVAQAYYAALQARHQLQVARDSLNLAQVQLKLVTAQYHAGVASRADVLTAQLPVAQAQLAVAQAANGELTQLALMLDTMGLPAQTPVTISDESAGTLPIPLLQDVLGVAQRNRPDLLAAQATSDSANAGLRAARLGLFPTISGSATSSTTATTTSTSSSPGNYLPGWNVGATISVPIFDGGLTRAQTAVAQGVADEANANLRSTQLLVSLNVQQAYLGVQTAEAGLTAANAEYAQARTVLDVTNAQYRAGVTTLPLLLNAQVGLSKAEGDQVNALYTYKTAWQQLLLSEGIIGQ